jgi:hypothetical protein
LAVEDETPAVAAGRRSVAGRLFFACLGLYLIVVGLGVAWAGGAKVLAGAGWAGEKGRLAVEKCVDETHEDSDHQTVRTYYCYGTFRPADGGKEIEDVLLKGGRGEAYERRSGVYCNEDTVDRPWWCPAEDPAPVAVRYVDGEAWIFGSGMFLPGSVVLFGLCGLGLALLVITHQVVWPDPERRPWWLKRSQFVVGWVFGAAVAMLLIALAFDVNG